MGKNDFASENILVEDVEYYKKLVGLGANNGNVNVGKDCKDDNGANVNNTDIEKIDKFLKIARDQKDFEIKLYWKRAMYFWGFVLAIYTAFFFNLKENDANPFYSLILSFLGLVFCVGFYFSNIGSRCWQENWEWHVDMLERAAGEGLFLLYRYYPKKSYSVSKINRFLSGTLIVAAFLIFGVCVFDLFGDCCNCCNCCNYLKFLTCLKQDSDYIKFIFCSNCFVIKIILILSGIGLYFYIKKVSKFKGNYKEIKEAKRYEDSPVCRFNGSKDRIDDDTIIK